MFFSRRRASQRFSLLLRTPLRSFASLFATAATLAALPLVHERDATACGGCFHPPNPPPNEISVVTDHRMAFALSPTQTVLWDQVRYSGDPREFAWVLPVRAGTRIELSRDEWFAALDQATQPTTSAPAFAPPQPPLVADAGQRPYPYNPHGGNYSSGCGGGGGCNALVGCSASASSDGFSADNGGGSGGAGSGGTNGGTNAPTGGSDPVLVLSQAVVGPYETDTLRSTDPAALETWLGQHGFDIPIAIRPILDEYVREGFDFIAMRLLPQCGVRAMRPVRVIAPGADPTLPLRMVAAGVGASVGLTLYVISEGRYRPANFPETTIDASQLRWDAFASRSNYAELALATMQRAGGRTWLTEFANRAAYRFVDAVHPSLSGSYFAMCGARPPFGGASDAGAPTPCTQRPDAGGPRDAGVSSDAASLGDADIDAGDDASAEGGGPPLSHDAGGVDPCARFDDFTVALRGLHDDDTWITRLRAEPPTGALDVDLRLEPSPGQEAVSSVHVAAGYMGRATGQYEVDPRGVTPLAAGDGASSACATKSSSGGARDAIGGWTLFGLTVLGVGAVLRRTRARRGSPGA